MSVFPKPYADLVARLRVTCGFIMVAAFAWFSRPDARSLAVGPAGLGARVAAARVGDGARGEEHPAGRERSLRLRAQSAVSGDVAGGGGIRNRVAAMAAGGLVCAWCFCSFTCPRSSWKNNTCGSCFPISRRTRERVPALWPTLTPIKRPERFRWELVRSQSRIPGVDRVCGGRGISSALARVASTSVVSCTLIVLDREGAHAQYLSFLEFPVSWLYVWHCRLYREQKSGPHHSGWPAPARIPRV